jgi:hypothetical protein
LVVENGHRFWRFHGNIFAIAEERKSVFVCGLCEKRRKRKYLAASKLQRNGKV